MEVYSVKCAKIAKDRGVSWYFFVKKTKSNALQLFSLFFTLTTLTFAIPIVFGGITLPKELLGSGDCLSCIISMDSCKLELLQNQHSSSSLKDLNHMRFLINKIWFRVILVNLWSFAKFTKVFYH